jgi:hypothetical protein
MIGGRKLLKFGSLWSSPWVEKQLKGKIRNFCLSEMVAHAFLSCCVTQLAFAVTVIATALVQSRLAYKLSLYSEGASVSFRAKLLSLI